LLEELFAGSGKLGGPIFHFYKMKDIMSQNSMQEKNDKTPQKCFTLRGAATQAAYRGRHRAIWPSTLSARAVF
jgi:hypothetical protein